MATEPPPGPLRKTLLRRIITADENLSYKLHSLFHPFLPTFLLLIFELSADFRFSFPVSLSLLLLRRRPLLFLPLLSPLLLGLLLDLILIAVIKLLFRRRRPPYNPAMSAVATADHFSFPSGHASRVFFLASLICLSSDTIQSAMLQFGAGDESAASAVLVAVCLWAALTASSRVLLGRHFVLDVTAGACLGVLEGLFAFRFLRFESLLEVKQGHCDSEQGLPEHLEVPCVILWESWPWYGAAGNAS